LHAPKAAPENGARKAKEPDPNWKSTRTPNLKIYVPSGVYFARLRVKGKLVRQSLETTVRSVAELELTDLVRHPSNARSAISLKGFQNGDRIQAMALHKIPSATDIPLAHPRPTI